MSIKIYDGMRIEYKDLYRFIKIFDNRCLVFLTSRTKELMSTVKDDVLYSSAEKAVGYRKDVPVHDFVSHKPVNDFFRFLEVCKMYIETMRKGYVFMNPECWFNAFPYDGYVYIIPEYPSGMHNVKYPKYVKEFGYWNNTDPPEGIDYKQFRGRYKYWNKSGALDIPASNKITHMFIDKDDISSLLRIEKLVVSDSGKFNGYTPFPACYTAMARLNEKNKGEIK